MRKEGRVPLDLVSLPERDLVWFILSQVGNLYEYFNFVVEPAIGPPPRQGWDYIFLGQVDRHLLGFSRDGLPGDIDVLIVPTFEDKPRVEYSCAIEVKRLALRGPNWTKNVDRYGISQASGMLADGFPFVGILHIVVAEPGPSENKRELEEWRILDGEGHAERVGPVLLDMTGYKAAERQLSRLAARLCPKEIGFNSVAIARTTQAEPDRLWASIRPDGTRFAAANPIQNLGLLKDMRRLIENYRDRIMLRPADMRKSIVTSASS